MFAVNFAVRVLDLDGGRQRADNEIFSCCRPFLNRTEMIVPRKRHSADLKVKVILEAMRSQKTTNEMYSDEYDLHNLL